MSLWTLCRCFVLVFGISFISANATVVGFLIEKTSNGENEAVPFSELFWESPDGGSITTLSGSLQSFEKANIVSYIYLNENYWRQMNSNSTYLPFRKDILNQEVVIPGVKDAITTDDEIRPFTDGAKALRDVIQLAPDFKDTLSEIQSELDNEVAHYQKGDRKVAGRWLSAADFAAQNNAATADTPQSLEITTMDGKIYKDVTGLKVTDDTISFICSTGGATLDLAILTPDLQKKFGYDPRAREQQRIADEKAAADADAAAKAAELAEREEADAETREFITATSKNTLSGQVFISTRGGDNIKLGGVHVYLYGRAQVNLIIVPRNQEAVNQVTALSAEIDKESKEYSNADAASQTQDALVENGEYIDPVVRKDNLQKSMQGLEQKRDLYLSPDYYFSGLPDPLAEAETDADGKFTMTVPPGKYVLAARATRSVLLSDEHYWWMIKFDMGTLSRSVLLSNDNLSSSGSDDSLIITKQD
jgi:hypothetical protein